MPRGPPVSNASSDVLVAIGVLTFIVDTGEGGDHRPQIPKADGLFGRFEECAHLEDSLGTFRELLVTLAMSLEGWVGSLCRSRIALRDWKVPNKSTRPNLAKTPPWKWRWLVGWKIITTSRTEREKKIF